MNKIDAANADLRDIPVELIDRNPENPRLVFRPQELETLQESISRYGVQVPISIFKKGKRYIPLAFVLLAIRRVNASNSS